MRVFRSIVESFVLTMLHLRQDFPFSSRITLPFVGNNHAWNILKSFEQFPEESFRCLFVSPTLHQDIKDVSVLIHSSPQGVFLSPDCENDLVHVPCVATARTAMTQFVGIRLPTFQALLPNRFIGHNHAPLCHKFLNISVTERKTKIEPDAVTDNGWWEAIAFVIRSR